MLHFIAISLVVIVVLAIAAGVILWRIDEGLKRSAEKIGWEPWM